MASNKSGNFFEEMQEHRNDPRSCDLRVALNGMPDEYREQVVEALLNRQYDGALIARTLRAKGYHVNEWTVRRCRRECGCGVMNGEK